VRRKRKSRRSLGEATASSGGKLQGILRLMHRRIGGSQSGNLILELKLPSFELCQPHVIRRRSVEGILDLALEGAVLPFQFRQVILQRHVSSSYSIY
jgi:hypothetical protein